MTSSLPPKVLDRLAHSALVVPVDGRKSWRFAHALIRDAAYAGLLTSRRKALHAHLADRLEATPAAGIGEAALHRVAAGEHARALPLLEEAARQARAIGAISEAAGFYATAAEVTAGDPVRAAEYRQAADAVANTSRASLWSQACRPAVSRPRGSLRPPIPDGRRLAVGWPA